MSREFCTERFAHERDSRNDADIASTQVAPMYAARSYQARRSTHPVGIHNVEHVAHIIRHPGSIAPSVPSSTPSICSLDTISTTSATSTMSRNSRATSNSKLSHVSRPRQPRRSGIRPGIIAIKSYTEDGEMIVEQFGLSRDPPTVTKSTNGGALARVEEKEKVQKTDIGTTNDYCLDEKDSGCEDVSRRGRRWMPNIWEGWRRGSA